MGTVGTGSGAASAADVATEQAAAGAGAVADSGAAGNAATGDSATGDSAADSGAAELVALVLAFAAIYVVWGSTYLGIAWAVETIPPFLMIGIRCALAGAILFGWSRWRGAARPTLADWRAAAVAGVLLFVTGQAVIAWAETRIPSGATSLLVATEPLFVALLGWQGGRWTGAASTSPGVVALGAILLGFAGVAVLVLPGAGGGLDPLGAGAAVLAALSWSLGMFRAGSRPGLRPGQVAGMQLLVAGAVLLSASVLSGEASGVAPGGPSGRSLAALLYLIVMGSVVTFGAYVWLLDRVGPARVSTHAYVNPIVAVAFGALLGGEAVTPSLVLATILILGAVAVLLRPRRRAVEVRRPALDPAA